MIDYGQGDGTLTRASGLVSDARADLTGTSARLADRVSAVRGGWGGQGASAFFALHQAWAERQASVLDALDDLARALEDTERTNVATDDAQGAAFAHLVGRLG